MHAGRDRFVRLHTLRRHLFVIEMKDVTKYYGNFRALDGISF